jgi:integrase
MKLSKAIAFTARVRRGFRPDAKGSRTALKNADHCLRHLGDVEVESITAFRVVELQDALKDEGYKNGTINRITSALSAVLSTLVRHKELTEVPYIEQLPEPKGRPDFYTTDEVERLLDACRFVRDGRLVWDAIQFGRLTGARKGEQLGLLWSDVFFDRSELVFRDTKNKGEDRWLPITGDLLTLMKRMFHERLSNDEVFPIKPGALLRRLKSAQEICGVSPTKVWHTLRHTTGTEMFANGAELPVVMEILGHSNARTTMRYSHATSEGVRKALETLSTTTPNESHQRTAELL